MLMFSGHIVGQPMSVAGRNGIFCLQVNITSFLTGVDKFLFHYLDQMLCS